MAVKTKSVLKTYFETGDKPTQEQFEDLVDTLVDQAQFDSANITNAEIDALS